MSSFDQAYARLNTAQKMAVDTIYGPVAVIAGPGTGKTQLLTLRIAHIIQSTDTHPRNILALTYTEAGSFAMRDRLASFIGSDALKVNISTFHSFCKDLIDSEFPEKFARTRDMKMLSDLDARRTIAQILLESTCTYLKPKFDPEMYMGDVIRIIGTCKREGISPSLLGSKIEKAIQDLPNNPELYYQKNCQYGKIGERKPLYRQEEEKLLRQRELVTIYDLYEKQLRIDSRYDYDDMLIMVRDTLKSDEEFLSILREEYQFIMVDEFQDTNSLQASIVHMIMVGLDQPNILVVGDDEQSIYRFQGAVMENILDFCDRYKSTLTLINLTENYRSSQTILDASRAFIRSNSTSLEKSLSLNKELHKNAPMNERLIECSLATDPQIEIAALINRLQRFHNDGIPWCDMAVIYRKNANPIHLIECMRRAGIPFYKQKGENLLHHPEAKKLLKVLQLINNIHNNALFWEVMLYDFWKLDLHHLLVIQNREKAQNGDIRRKLWEVFLHDEDILVRDVTQKLVDLHGILANKTITQFFEDFLVITGYRAYALAQEDAIERLGILNAFFDEVKTFSSNHNDAGITEFIEYMNDLEHYGLAPLTQPIRMTDDAVELMTAHGSKGLEYRVVCLYDATSKNWEARRDPSKLTLSVSIFDAQLLDKNTKKTMLLEEERRLWYVAMTRAKEHLCIFATKNAEIGSDPSLFISEIPDEYRSLHTPQIPPESIITIQTSTLPLINWSEATRQEIADRAKRYRLSVTALNTWVKSPHEFYIKHLLKQPASKAPILSFGTAVHEGLASIGNYFSIHGVLPDRSIWIDEIRTKLYHEILTSREQADFLAQATDLIDVYLSKKDCPLASRALIEYSLGNKKIVVEGIPITGKIDRVEYLPDGSVQVVDFKTGKAKKTSEQLLDYERQLYFYYLLWEGSGSMQTLSHGVLDFVEDAPGDTVNRLVFSFESDGLTKLHETIRAFAHSLATLDFPEVNTFLDNTK